MVAALRVLDALAATSPSVGVAMDICRIGPDGLGTSTQTRSR